jgi:hypothetical protein
MSPEPNKAGRGSCSTPLCWRAFTRTAAVASVLATAWSQFAIAQQAPGPSAPIQQQAPAPQPFQQSHEWGNLPKMVLERQFSGPLQDTVIQRLRDPVDGTVCYLYLPISAPHSPTTSTGFVQNGPNAIGGISCMPGRSGAAPASAPAPQGQRK